MPDKKISQLTGATTPLAGTETLPIVQSSATVKVSVADLTAGRAVGMLSATAGNVQVSGNTIASTNTNGNLNIAPNGFGEVIIPNSADADAKLILSGYGVGGDPYIRGYDRLGALNFNLVCDSDINSRAFTFYGNVVIGTSGKGIDFSATPGTGTSELFADYEEGTWTPTITAITGSYTTVTSQSGTYTKVGRQVTVTGYFIVSNKGTGTAGANVTNLPFAMNGTRFAGTGHDTSTAATYTLYTDTSATTISIYKYDGTDPIVANRGNVFELTYFV